MIEVKQLTQVYRSGKGIFAIDFSVSEGEVFGYLGPNGAGKTTTIRNMLGFANASEGSVTINGMDCRREAAKLQNIIGYLPGEMAFIENMTGMEFLRFMSRMRGTKDLTKMKQLIQLMELEVDGKMKKMSKGMKQKIGIITAFMHDPLVYILDEPTSGLDPFMQNVFMELVAEEKKRGKTILMSSHIFEEVQRSCDRAGIIRDGKLVAIEDVSSLNKLKSTTYITKVVNGAEGEKLMNLPLQVEKVTEKKYHVTVTKPFSEVFALLSNINITSFESKEESLEDVFMKYYGDSRKAGDDNE